MRVSRAREGLTRRYLFAIALATSVVVAACGKTGTLGPLAGVYHLTGSAQPTNLELRTDGTFTLRRDSCESTGGLECGVWRRSEITGSSQVVARDGLYWPTPDDFPSAVVRALSLRPHGGDLEIVGESEWAGSFTQRWTPGRTCGACGEHPAEHPCTDPLPACTPAR